MPITPKIDWDTDDTITHTDMNRIETNTIINENAITNNGTDIAVNAADIATNVTNIANNGTDIAANAADIDSLEEKFQISDHVSYRTDLDLTIGTERRISRNFTRVDNGKKLMAKTARYRFNNSDLRLRLKYSNTTVWTSADAANKTSVETAIFDNTGTATETGTLDIFVYNSAAGTRSMETYDSWWLLFELEDS